MKILLPCALFVLASTGAAGSATQTDWSGGGGFPGPLFDWGTSFDWATGIDWLYAPGFLQLGGILITPETHLFDGSFYANCVISHDVDGDGVLDVLACGIQYVAWWRNEGGAVAWTKILISSNSPGSTFIDAGDIDGDGDCDVVLAQNSLPPSRGLYWFENTDGSGTGWVKHSIIGVFTPCRVCASDINGDGDLDVAFIEADSDSVCWYENVDGAGMQWHLYVTVSDATYETDLGTVDLDMDGDIDLLSADSDGFIWYENTDGTGTTLVPHDIGVSISPRAVSAFDIDNDGDLDVQAGCSDHTGWYENLDGTSTAWVFHQVSGTTSLDVLAFDADADGDGDLLSAVTSLVLWRNEDGVGTSWTSHELVPGSTTNSCGSGDLDGDGFADALATQQWDSKIYWCRMIETAPSGELSGSILDTEDDPLWGTISWMEYCPSGTDVSVDVRAGDDPADMSAWFTCNTPGTAIPSTMDHHPYFQYRVNLDRGAATLSPTLQNLAVTWNSTGIPGDQEAECWSLAPLQNPARGGVLGMSIGAAEAGPVAVRVFDLSGRVVAETELQASAGLQTVSFTGLPAGVFLCTAEVPGYTCAVRVVVLD